MRKISQCISNVFVVVGFIGLCVGLLSAAPSDADEMKDVLARGIRAEQSGEYARAVEYFRQVLYFDGANSRAQFGIAYCAEQEGDSERARKEFERFLAVSSRDRSVQESEREEFVAYAKKVIGEKETDSKKRFSFFAIDVFVLTAVVTILLLCRLMCFWRSRRPKHDEEFEAIKKVWIDCEWLHGKEREIDRSPISYITIGMIVLAIVLYIMSYVILSQ